MLRTRVGSDADGRFVARDLDALKEIRVRGPLLAAAGGALYVPAARDALAIRGHKEALFALHPIERPSGVLCDGDAPKTLVGMDNDDKLPEGKAEALPAWWRWAEYERWLTAPASLPRDVLEAHAIRALPRERRVHVKLTADGVAEDAMLFETEGLRFTREDAADPLTGGTELGLYLDAAGEGAPRAGLGAFAGERRLVRWEASTTALPTMPEALQKHLDAAKDRVTVRVVLLTPACFTSGSQPGLTSGPLASRDGVTAQVLTSLVQRPETVSGWDFHKTLPKGTRRLVSAGSVFWVELTGSPTARRAWAERVWMHNVSDAEQDRRDGYGLAALGVG